MKNRKNTKLIYLVLFILLIVIITSIILLIRYSDIISPNNPVISDNTAVRIIDGDTFELASGEVVRLICVDAPETGKTGADEATEFLSTLILAKELRLENDTDDKDAYGRLLRYVYLDSNEGKIFVNKEIVKQGYGSVFRYGNDTSKCEEIDNESKS